MSKLLRKFLVALDFDHTIINDNSDTYISKLIPSKKIPSELKALYKKNGWTRYMGGIFELLHANGTTKEDILRCLEDIPFTDGMEELFASLPSDKTEFIIISDSNTVFINHILKTKGFLDLFSSIFTNPAEFREDGCLAIEMYHVQDFCKLSTVNMCKGNILSKFVEDRASEGIEYEKIAYVGDGFHDFCPSLRLQDCDGVFPRLNYKLFQAIPEMEKERQLKLKAHVFPWTTGKDILAVLLPWYKDINSTVVPNPRLVPP